MTARGRVGRLSALLAGLLLVAGCGSASPGATAPVVAGITSAANARDAGAVRARADELTALVRQRQEAGAIDATRAAGILGAVTAVRSDADLVDQVLLAQRERAKAAADLAAAQQQRAAAQAAADTAAAQRAAAQRAAEQAAADTAAQRAAAQRAADQAAADAAARPSGKGGGGKGKDKKSGDGGEGGD